MKELYLGKIVNTHGLKGEVRILSDFEKKDRIFQPGKRLYIGPSRQEVTILIKFFLGKGKLSIVKEKNWD